MFDWGNPIIQIVAMFFGMVLILAVLMVIAFLAALYIGTRSDVRTEDPMGQYDPKELQRGWLSIKYNNLMCILGQ